MSDSADNMLAKDAQTSFVKLWELIKNSSEIASQNKLSAEERSQAIVSMEQSVRSREKELSELKENHSKLSSDHETLQSVVHTLEESVANLTAKLSDYNNKITEIAELRAVNLQQSQRIEALTEKVNQIPELTQQIENEKAIAQENYSNYKKTLDELGEYKRLDNDYDIAQQEIVRRNHEMLERRNELIKLKDDYALLQSKFFSLKQVENEIIEKNNEIETLKNVISSRDELIKELNFKSEEEKVKYLAMKSKFEEDLNEARRITSAHEQTITELLGRTLSTTEENQDLEKKILNLSEEHEKLKEDQDYLHSTLIETNNELKRFQQYQELYEDEKASRQKFSDSLQELAQSFDELSNKNLLLESEHQELKESYLAKIDELALSVTKYEELSRIYSEMEDNMKELTDRANAQTNEISDKSRKLLELESQLVIIESKVRIQQAENVELSDEIEKYNVLKHKFDMLENEFSKLEQDNTDLMAKIAEYEAASQTDKAEIDAANQKIEDLQNELNKVRSQFDLLALTGEELSQAKNEIEKLKLHIENLDNESQKMNLSVIDKNTMLASLENALKNITSDNEKLYDELDDIQKKYDVATAHINELESALDTAHAQLVVPTENAEQAKKIQDLEEIVSKLESAREMKEIQIQSLTERNESLEHLVHTRYEHIQLLEGDISEMSNRIKNTNKIKAELISKIDSALEKIETLN